MNASLAQRQYYAHSLEGQPPEKWQKLKDHLRNVAKLAREFAEPFGGGDWGWNAGWLHGVGMAGCMNE
jgi:CRISPR-associated endonuclease/helicase Cas3